MYNTHISDSAVILKALQHFTVYVKLYTLKSLASAME